MTSTIYLYKDSKITPERNFIVEDVEEYLSTLLNTITINGFQYLRNDLKLTIKINRGEESVDTIKANNYNYLRVIQNSVSYYYFIVKKTQLATSTIALELALDSINTFLLGRDFYATNRTRVLREHKDRLKRYVHALDFNNLETASWAIGNPFPDAGSPFNVNVELESAQGDFVSFSAVAHYYDEGSHKSLYLSQISIENGLELFNALDPIKIQIFNEDFSTFYASIVNFENVSITPHYNILRNIDYYGEGINPVLYKKELGSLFHKENATWNLLYYNDENEAISCFCLPSESGINASSINSGSLTYADFTEGVYYNFCPFDEESIILKDNNDKNYSIKVANVDGQKRWIIKQVLRTGTTLKIRAIHGVITNNRMGGISRYIQVYGWTTITSLSYEVETLYYRTTTTSPDSTHEVIMNPSNGNFSTTGSELPLEPITDINRADPKLIKIIEIPYFPSNYSYEEDLIETDSTWAYSTQDFTAFKLNDLNAKFSSNIESNVENPLNVFDLGSLIPTIGVNRNDYYESKLFHSEFYQPKFVYDSFGFVFELEKIDEALFTPSAYFSFEFVMTSTINSKFMFRFPEYILKLSEEDYDNILVVSRNNESPIYNSAYIQYVNTGYNYDLKSKQATETTIYGAGLTGFGASLGRAVGGAVSEDYGQVVSGFIGAEASIIGTIIALKQKERSFEKNLAMLKNQANSVSGSNDLDLMDAYTGNRAKLCLYEVSPRMKKLLSDLFYYFGYTTDEIKIPDLYTRYYFNYLSCELEMTGVSSNISELIKEDIKNKYLKGITLLHNTGNEWEFEQTKENWEIDIL